MLCAAIVLKEAAPQTTAIAAEYPARPIRYIVSSAAGGALDAKLTRQMRHQVVVDN